jgi:hypothetical protein
MTPDLTPLLEAFADMVADRVVQKLRATNDGMIGQEQSPLGRRRHCAAVQRRVASGQMGAAIVGRKHLLTQAALSEELARLGPASKKAIAFETPSIGDQLSASIAEVQHSNAGTSIGKSNGSRRSHPSSKNTPNRMGAP